ncbi:uncharacterized protein LOC124263197 [Haliotis rubra]|uniref:uncharacterized protein LOC124263197 n=1 Tax=Haliotis rubra TaxID=36100 RepID=UPI001EE6141F|nr:uncharacterized protein LOC124263197 [Haliotis rubra]
MSHCPPEDVFIYIAAAVSSCSEVRQLSSTYTDGEYWLYPRLLNGSRVKVYCHAMNSTPSEYISLSTPYVINETQVNNCSWWHSTRFYLGYYVLTKFGLDIENLSINKSDTTFFNKTDSSGAISSVVGKVFGCSHLVNSTCGSAGRAVLDLRGTGLNLRGIGLVLNNTAKTLNYSFRDISTATLSQYNQLVEFRCALYCGVCFVTVPMYLSVAETDGNYAVNGLQGIDAFGIHRLRQNSTRRQCNNPDLCLNLVDDGSNLRLFDP